MGKIIFQWAAITLFGFSLVFLSSPAMAETQWDLGVSGGSQGLSGFHLSVGNYYRVPEREVVVIRERGIPDEELPVVFFLCRHARVSPEVVIGHRSRGMSWHDITLHLGLSPEIYYVPVVVHRGGPPYGHAYGHYKKHPRQKWAKMRLEDAAIVNQVNLEFVTRHHGYDPSRVMRMREHGASFVNIERKVYREKAGKGNGRRDEVRSERTPDHGWKDKKGNGDRFPPGHGKKRKD